MTWKLEESKSFLAQNNSIELTRKAGPSNVEDGRTDDETVKMPPNTTVHMTDNQRAAVRLRMVLNFCMMVLFAGCTFVQYNDPDPALWMPVYGVPCLLCLTDLVSSRFYATVMRSLLRPIHLLYCLGVLIATVVLLAIYYSVSNFSQILEYFRELSGLMIVFGWYLTASILISDHISSQIKLESGCAYAVLIIVLLATVWACATLPDGHGPDHFQRTVYKNNETSFSLHTSNNSWIWPFN